MKKKSGWMAGNISTGVYAICFIVIAVFAASNLYVLGVSGDIANDVRAEAEGTLIINELDRQKEILVRDQSQISYWDDTVKALGDELDLKFVQEELAEWLWEDFGIHASIVVGATGEPRVVALLGTVLSPDKGRGYVEQSQDLIDLAKKAYYSLREETYGGYVLSGSPLDESKPAYIADIRPVDGQLGIVVAQAIVPDDEALLPPGDPQILLTFKPFSKDVVAKIGEKLGLKDFQLAIAGEFGEATMSLALETRKSEVELQAAWTASQPSAQIWKQAQASLMVAFLMIGIAMVFVVLKFGRAVQALKSSEEKNRFLALHDALTGLPNRLQFDRALEDIIEEGEQDRCAILCADLDRFKAVNDTYGHQAGDTVIKTVADRLASGVGDRGMVARIGGDEFIILLRDKLDKDHVLWLCEELIEDVCKEIEFDGGATSVGASFGVAWWPDDALTAKNIIRSADEALYMAKENGRGCTRCAPQNDDQAPAKDEIAA